MSTVDDRSEERSRLQALPWPWRACRGGRVLAANGRDVIKVADRREALKVVREVEKTLRPMGVLDDDSIARRSYSGDDAQPAPGELFINGVRIYQDDWRNVTAAAFVAEINKSAGHVLAWTDSSSPGTVVLQMQPQPLRSVKIDFTILD